MLHRFASIRQKLFRHALDHPLQAPTQFNIATMATYQVPKVENEINVCQSGSVIDCVIDNDAETLWQRLSGSFSP